MIKKNSVNLAPWRKSSLPSLLYSQISYIVDNFTRFLPKLNNPQ